MHFHTNISVLQVLGGRGHVIAIGIEYYNLCPVSKAGITRTKWYYYMDVVVKILKIRDLKRFVKIFTFFGLTKIPKTI